MTEQFNELIERVASIQKAIVGPGAATIRIAEAYPPSDVSRYEVPFFINEVHGGETSFRATGGRQNVHTTVKMFLCTAIRSSGNLAALQKAALAWRNYVLQAFALKIRLGNDLSYILEATIVKWDLVDYEYGSTSYVALVFDLEVIEYFMLTVAA